VRYRIEIQPAAARELRQLRAFEARIVRDAIDSRLREEPANAARNRKRLDGRFPGYRDETVWELRTGILRIFYDVDVDGAVVRIHAIRRKPGETTTGELIS
jgi:mRNA-degrading endonuclease RelE of RelBE toxin-antitoxin system